jgi:hypothetical protein
MKKQLTLLFLSLLHFSAIGQSLSDTIVNVFFNKIHDTVIVIKSSKYSKEKDNLIYYKTYNYVDSIKSPITEPCYKPYSNKSIKIIIDSLHGLGYTDGINVSTIIKTYSQIFIKKETMDKTFGNLYNYDLCRNIILNNDTIYKDNYYNEEQRINHNLDPNREIVKNIQYEVVIWQSKDRRLLYCIFNSGRVEYGVSDGNEYYVSTTQIEILKK